MNAEKIQRKLWNCQENENYLKKWKQKPKQQKFSILFLFFASVKNRVSSYFVITIYTIKAIIFVLTLFMKGSFGIFIITICTIMTSNV